MKTRHKRIRELMLPCHAQTLQILSEGRLCVGYPSGFSIYSILGDHHPICKYDTKQIHLLYCRSVLFYRNHLFL